MLIGRVLHDAKTFSTDIRVTLLRLLAYGAIQDDFGMILHMDRKDHFIMNYAKDFESIPILEQEALALFVSIISIPFFKIIFILKHITFCRLTPKLYPHGSDILISDKKF